MADPVELMLADLTEQYAQMDVRDAFLRLYKDDRRFGRMFASLHQRLNEHFEAVNDRANTTHHYWADNSREMLKLIAELGETLESLRSAGIEVTFSDEYRAALERCRQWLSQSGGSTVPDDFQPIRHVKYEPVFARLDTIVRLQKQVTPIPLKMVGEGSYATVFSFTDPDYGIKFALKRAKKGLDERDLHRFKEEFGVLKKLSFPYVVEVYEYDETRNEYKMEFCDETLRTYIASRNDKMSFATRKRIALQFLYGINYLHRQRLLHRDISLQNVLLKVFDGGAVLVKLSDFGLVKDQASEFTRTKTEMRGTIRDPLLVSFRDYSALNEIYSIGWVLSYIFTGKEALTSGSDTVGRIVRKCVAHDLSERYQDLPALIADVERLAATPTDATA